MDGEKRGSEGSGCDIRTFGLIDFHHGLREQNCLQRHVHACIGYLALVSGGIQLRIIGRFWAKMHILACQSSTVERLDFTIGLVPVC